MFFWSQYPAFRVFIPFATGIILGYFDLFGFYTALFLFVIHGGICFHIGRTSKFLAPFFLLAWLFLGASIQLSHSSLKKEKDINALKGEQISFLASLKELPSKKGKTASAMANIHAVYRNKNWEKINACVYISFTDNLEKIPQPENYFTGVAEFKTIAPSIIPGDFDFASYLKKKDVFLQCRLKKLDYRILSEKRPAWHKEVFAAYAGEHTLEIMSNIGLGEEDRSVGAALIMGNDALIHQETVKKYAATGALHILSVSGLHVGIVYLLLNAFLKHFNGGKKTRILKLVLMLSGIWCYAIATGMSSSVIRSANMLSIMVIGETIGRKGFSVNTLAASALIQCLIQPSSLLEPGFQLSYLAVLGILIVYKPLNLLFKNTNPVINHIISVCCVSFAAQLFTFPLSLYYFHQFPNYFLPANLLIIPVSGIVLYAGLALLISNGIPHINDVNIFILKYSLRLMNYFVDLFAGLPYATIENIILPVEEMLTWYLMIFCTCLFFKNNKFIFLKLSGILFSIIIIINIINEYKYATQKLWEIYETPTGAVITIINGKKMTVLASGEILKSDHIKKKINNRKTLMGIEELEIKRTDGGDKRLTQILVNRANTNNKNVPYTQIQLKTTQRYTWKYHSGITPVNINFLSSPPSQEP